MHGMQNVKIVVDLIHIRVPIILSGLNTCSQIQVLELISEFGISLRMRQLRVIRDKQAFSATEVAREEYLFCGPSLGMFC